MNAWIVTWEGTSENKNRKIVAAWNHRYCDRTVRRLVEELYIVITDCSDDEKLRYANNKKSNPYHASNHPYGDIVCGHNPWLCARYVRNIRKVDGDYIWDEIKLPKNLPQ